MRTTRPEESIAGRLPLQPMPRIVLTVAFGPGVVRMLRQTRAHRLNDRLMHKRTLLALSFIALAASTAHAAGKPVIGIGFSIETDGLFSTTLKKVTVTSVKPGLPAEKAGVQAGDEIVSANDVPVAGTPGGKLKDVLENAKPGDHLKLRVHRGNADQLCDIVVGER
jgi:predicted metalloprotease with PDZ domain